LQEPYNKALADVYGSIAGVPAVGLKALGGVASGYGMYKGAKVVGSMLSVSRFNLYAPEGAPVPRADKIGLRPADFKSLTSR
jgi:hypothetical protein